MAVGEPPPPSPTQEEVEYKILFPSLLNPSSSHRDGSQLIFGSFKSDISCNKASDLCSNRGSPLPGSFIQGPKHQSTQTNFKPSYADLLKGNHISSNSNHTIADDSAGIPLSAFDLKPISKHQGKPAIIFRESEKMGLIEKMNHVLIAKWSHGRPSMSTIRNFFLNLHLKGDFNLAFYDSKHMFVECVMFEDFVKIWLKVVWVINGFPLRVFKWTETFHPSIESALAPIWIHLPRLPLFLYDEASLLSIANAIGRPLKIDPCNILRTKLGCASICVEVDVSIDRVDDIWISFSKDGSDSLFEGFWQKVVYGVMPPFCKGCEHLGHSVSSCKRTSVSKNGLVAKEGSMEHVVVLSNRQVNLEANQFCCIPIDSVHARIRNGLQDLGSKGGASLDSGIFGEVKQINSATLEEGEIPAAGAGGIPSAGGAGAATVGEGLVSRGQTLFEQNSAEPESVNMKVQLQEPSRRIQKGKSFSSNKLNAIKKNFKKTHCSGVDASKATAEKSVADQVPRVVGKEQAVLVEKQGKESLGATVVSQVMGKPVLLNCAATAANFCNIPVGAYTAGENAAAGGVQNFVAAQITGNAGRCSAGATRLADEVTAPVISATKTSAAVSILAGSAVSMDAAQVSAGSKEATEELVQEGKKGTSVAGHLQHSNLVPASTTRNSFACLNDLVLIEDSTLEEGELVVEDDCIGTDKLDVVSAPDIGKTRNAMNAEISMSANKSIKQLEGMLANRLLLSESNAPTSAAAVAGSSKHSWDAAAITPGVQDQAKHRTVTTYTQDGVEIVAGQVVQELEVKKIQSSKPGKVEQVVQDEIAANDGLVLGKNRTVYTEHKICNGPAGNEAQVERVKGLQQLGGMLITALVEAAKDTGNEANTRPENETILHQNKSMNRDVGAHGLPTEAETNLNTKCSNSHTASITPRKLSSAAAEFTPKWAVLVEELVEDKKQSDPVLIEKEVEQHGYQVTRYGSPFLSDDMGDIICAFKCKSVPNSPSHSRKQPKSIYDSPVYSPATIALCKKYGSDTSDDFDGSWENYDC